MRQAAKSFFVKGVLPVVLGAFVLLVFFVVLFMLKCSSPQSEFRPLPGAPKDEKEISGSIAGYARPAENTYLTYPEWYIVYSYQERADFLERNLPSQFPHFASIAQYWRGYCCALGITRSRYPFNVGNHVMLFVIGTSFSVEYAIRGAYESTVGELSEWTSSYESVAEDEYAYRVAKQYAEFVHVRPFYEFSFATRLKGLWKETDWWGPHPARKWERKAILSLDYGLQAAYCWLIEKATHATYGFESAGTYAWIENAPEEVLTENPRIRNVKEVGPQSYIVVIPRYHEFTDTVSKLARLNVHFVNIAGNHEILLTAIAPQAWTFDLKDAELLFSTSILTQPNLKRIALRSPVRSLHTVLGDLEERGIRIEHVYDF